MRENGRRGLVPIPRCADLRNNRLTLRSAKRFSNNETRVSEACNPTTLRSVMSGKEQGRDPYLVKSVVHSSQLLSAFRSSGEALPLREVAARSGLPKSMAFRLLYTLERCGMIEKVGENLYRSYVRPLRQ